MLLLYMVKTHITTLEALIFPIGGRFSNLDTRQTPLPGEEKQVWSDIESTQVIPIKKLPCTRQASAQPDCPTSSRREAI